MLSAIWRHFPLLSFAGRAVVSAGLGGLERNLQIPKRAFTQTAIANIHKGPEETPTLLRLSIVRFPHLTRQAPYKCSRFRKQVKATCFLPFPTIQQPCFDQ